MRAQCHHGNERHSQLGVSFAMGNDGDVTYPPPGFDVPLSERPPTRRAGVMAATGLVSSLMISILTVAPAPFAIAQAGPTYDTLAAYDGTSVIGIDGLPTYESTGELRLTTVSFSRGGSRTFTLGQVIGAYFSENRTVRPEEDIFGTPEQQQREAEESQEMWVISQESATVAAIEALGEVVPTTLTVAEITDASGALGVLEDGDVLVAIDGEEFLSYNDLTTQLERRRPGDEPTFTVLRGSQELELTFPLIAYDDDPDSARMGIYVLPTFDLPITVNVGIAEVSGPSAGLMFALAIMDKLTPADELNGARVAGTGAIDIDGQVSPIGGIDHKMDGAAAAGATAFLAPIENCQDVVGHVPPGLDVYAVDTLVDAYAAIVSIGQNDTADLLTCAAAVEKE